MNKSSMQAPTATSKFTGTTGPMGITNIIGEQDEGRMAAQTPAPSLIQPQSSALTGGQPAGLQQGMQEKMFSNVSTGEFYISLFCESHHTCTTFAQDKLCPVCLGANSTADPQMCRVVQQQMNHSSSPVDAKQMARVIYEIILKISVR